MRRSKIKMELTATPAGSKKDLYPLILKLAGKKYRAANSVSSLDIEDLTQEGALALMQSVHRYKPELGFYLTTFAYRRVSGAISEAVSTAKRHEPMETPNSPTTDPSFAKLEDSDLFNQVMFCIEKRLSPRHAVILVRSYLEDADDDSICKELAINMEVLELERNNALQAVRSMLGVKI